MRMNIYTGRKVTALKYLALTSTALAGLGLPMCASAQDWVGGAGGQVTTGIDWYNPANWDPATVPTSSSDVTIDTISPAATFIDGGNAQAKDIIVGDSGSGQLGILNGGTLATSHGVVGNLAGSDGSVVVLGAGSAWTNSANLTIGEYGTGTLNILNGGAVSSLNSFISNSASAVGAVTVDGPGSTWTNGGYLEVGRYGTGSLTISNGGKVTDNSGFVGSYGNGHGTAAVAGPGSIWTHTDRLYVGANSTGTLTISNGGAVSNVVGYVGYSAGSTGTATVDGAGSTWTNSLSLSVGELGTGTLNILNGGAVSSLNSFISNSASAVGAVTVDGPGSTWTNGGYLEVGRYGTGSLTISNGGKVTDNSGFVGSYGTGHGTAAVTGPGSTWTNTDRFYVGANSTGTLTISNGGAVSNVVGYVGYSAGSTGTATVDGAGSTWTNTGDLYVGKEGTGTLNVTNGGAVNNATGTVASAANSTGTATVDGAGSIWTNSSELFVGRDGAGALTISNGGVVSSNGGYVGRSLGSNGAVTVTGVGSAWTSGIALEVGYEGTGTLTIAAGGTVTADSGDVGLFAGGVGTVIVDGTGSTLAYANDLVLGFSGGTGTLAIQNGGKVTSFDGTLGSQPGSVGTANITGAGSTWTNAGDLVVGHHATGTLVVSSGGVVTSTSGIVGRFDDSMGMATVTGAGSTWSNGTDLTVGEYGPGTLTIADGGTLSAGGVVRLAVEAGSTGTLNIGAAIGSSAAGAGTLNATSLQFGLGTGVVNFNHIGSNYQFNAAMAGGGSINQYAGTTVLTGNSSMFAGETQVTGGRLLVNGTLGGITGVMSGGSLGGSGTLTGPVSVASGGTLIGVQGQVLTMADLNLAGGANVDVTLSNPGGAALFNITNNLTLDGALNITSGGVFGPGIYSLMTYGGALTDNGLDIGTTPFGTTTTDFAVQTAVAGQVNLVSTALPNLSFWDGNGAGAADNGVVDGGFGEWTATGTNWTDFSGTTNGVLHPQPGFAIFQGAAGVVMVDAAAGNIAVTGMQFARDGYQVIGDAITLADPNSIIRVGDGSAAGSAYAATIGSVLTGTGGLNKTDLGTLILTANNDYTGGTTITDGTLQIGDGGTSGSVVGDIIADGRLSFARSDIATFAGAISGHGAIEQDGAGTTRLTGDSSGFTGLVNVNSGTLAITGGGKLSDSQAIIANAAGSVGAVMIDGAGSTWANSANLIVGNLGNGTLAIANGGAVSNATGIVASGANTTGVVTVDGAGSTWVNNLGTIIGLNGAGALNVTNGGSVTGAAGVLGSAAGSSGTATIDGAGSTWANTGVIYVGFVSNGALTIANGGSVSAGGAVSLAVNAGSTGVLNIGAAAGLPAAGAGTLNTATVQFGQGAGAINFNHSGTNYAFSAAMSGTGTINQFAGMTNLTGNSNGFFGAVNVNGGRLAVNGSLANGHVTVNSGGTLGGNGIIGHLTAQAGSIVAPGNSIGTLNVAGNASFAAGSTYQVELNAAGQSDLIHVAGTATIANGALLSVTKTDATPYVLGTRYTVLTAAGGVSGAYTFDPIQLTNFIGVVAGADANSVYLDVAKTKSFASAGATPNQQATGEALDSLPLPGSLPIAIANLPTDAAAQAAFDQLSGEIHASAKSVMIEDSRFVREAALDRLRHTLGGTGAAATGRVTLWGQGFGARARMDSDGNAASVQRDNSGLFIGADGMVGDKWRAGFIGGYSRSTFDARARGSSGTSDNYHVGAFAGAQWGKLAFRSGLAYTLHDISTTRSIAFPGFSDALKGDYHARTTQAFGELGYSLKSGKAAFEPFANLAYVNLSAGGLTETGGAAALTSHRGKSDVTFTTLGLRAASGFALDNGMKVTARAMLGWRHAFGDTTPVSTIAFAGGSPFRIGGVPVAQDAAAVDVGLDMNIGANAVLGLSYGGQFGSGVADQTIRANFAVRF